MIAALQNWSYMPPYSHLELALTGIVFLFFIFLRQIYM